MIKKILPITLCLVLVFGISASAENSTDSTNADAPAVSEEMPMQGARPGGGRSGMGAVPQGENMPSGEMPPAMPEGEAPPVMPEGEMPTGEAPPVMPGGEMTPPQDSGLQENTQRTEAAETKDLSGILDFIKTYSTPITAVILLAFAFVFVIFYKRKTY